MRGQACQRRWRPDVAGQGFQGKCAQQHVDDAASERMVAMRRGVRMEVFARRSERCVLSGESVVVPTHQRRAIAAAAQSRTRAARVLPIDFPPHRSDWTHRNVPRARRTGAQRAARSSRRANSVEGRATARCGGRTAGTVRLRLQRDAERRLQNR